MKPDTNNKEQAGNGQTSLARRLESLPPAVVDCEPIFVDLRTTVTREQFETAVEEQRGKKLDLKLNNFMLWLMRPLVAWAVVFTITLFSIVYWAAIARGLGLNPRPWENGWKWRQQGDTSAAVVAEIASTKAMPAVPKMETLLRTNERLIKMTTTSTGIVLQVERFVPFQ